MARTRGRPLVQLDHVVLEVRDVRASLKSYGGVFGLAHVREREFLGGRVPFASVRVNRGTLIDLFPRKMWGGRRPANPNHFCLAFCASAFRKLCDRFTSRGVEIVRTAEHNYGALGYASSIYVRDPDGVEVEARYYPPKGRRRRTTASG